MNDNFGETPNPLNPTANNTSRTIPVRQMSSANSTPSNTKINSLDPMGRPMEQVAQPEPPKKKKTGLIAGIIAALLVLIGGGVALAMTLINLNKPDAVATAIEKLLTEAPANVVANGSIEVALSSTDYPLAKAKIDVDSSIITSSAINTTTATLTITTDAGQDYALKINEIYADGGDFYIKLDDVTAFMEDSGLFGLPSSDTESDCASDETDCLNATECEGADSDDTIQCTENTETESASVMQGMLLSIAEAVDGEWFKLSADEIAQYGATLSGDITSCMIELAGEFDKNSNSIAQLYNKYPFISADKDSKTITSKENPVYGIAIDNEKLVSFVNSIQNPDVANNLYNCMGWDGASDIDVEGIAEATGQISKMQVEINDNYEFSRLYLEMELEESDTSLVVDLSLSYPDRISVSGPEEYTDLSTLIQDIMMNAFTTPTDETEQGETETEEETSVDDDQATE